MDGVSSVSTSSSSSSSLGDQADGVDGSGSGIVGILLFSLLEAILEESIIFGVSAAVYVRQPFF